MKKAFSALCLLLAFTMLFSPLGYAAGKNTDTLADWNVKITVPDGKTAVLKGEEYYIYAEKTGYIPYVMLRTYAYENEEDFISAFTEYMRGEYPDLTVTAGASAKTIGDKNCREVDYAYTISGYQAADRRIILSTNGRTYMFCSKEIPELDLTIGDMLEQVVADCEFLPAAGADAPMRKTADEQETKLTDAYLYCLDNGMPKYWLDFSGAITDNLVLHCFFRSSDPTFYKSYFILDLRSAETTDNGLVIHKVWDSHGFDRSDWFKSLVLSGENGKLVMEVERDERTLVGGGEDNVLTGRYVMEPAGVGRCFEYRGEDRKLKYWLYMEKSEIELHALFRSGNPEPYEEVYHIMMSEPDADGLQTVTGIFNSAGIDVTKQFENINLSGDRSGVVLEVKRDESTLAGAAEDNILTGSYSFAPSCSLAPLHEGPYTAEELARMAQIEYFEQTGFYPPEADAEKNADGTFTIHLYEIVDTGDFLHTATSAWYTVDAYGVGADDIRDTEVNLTR